MSKLWIPIVGAPLLVVAICVLTHAFLLTLSIVMLLGAPHARTILWLTFSGLAHGPALLWLVLPLLAIAATHTSDHREKSS